MGQQNLFMVDGHRIEIVEVHTLGFDIYVDCAVTPVNSDTVYFGRWPAWTDLLPYIADSGLEDD